MGGRTSSRPKTSPANVSGATRLSPRWTAPTSTPIAIEDRGQRAAKDEDGPPDRGQPAIRLRQDREEFPLLPLIQPPQHHLPRPTRSTDSESQLGVPTRSTDSEYEVGGPLRGHLITPRQRRIVGT